MQRSSVSHSFGNTGIDKPVIYHTQQLRYQIIIGCIQWNVLGSLNGWIITKSTNKTTYSKEFDEVLKVMLDGISYNMELLVQIGRHGNINSADPNH